MNEEIKQEIIKNFKNIDVTELDQNIHGKDHYKNLSVLITALLEVGFNASEVQSLLNTLSGLNLKDKGLVSRWEKQVMKKSNPNIALLYLQKLLGIKFKNVKLKPMKINPFLVLKQKLLKKNNKRYSTSLVKYLRSNANFIQDEFDRYRNVKNVTSVLEFFKIMFNDPDFDEGIYGLITNHNKSSKDYFNECIFDTTKSDKKLSEFTHFCINRPYVRTKDKYEGVAEADIINARYFVVECDEGLDVDDQILFAKLMVIKGLPIKMITKSGNKSVHIIFDLRMHIFEALKKLNKLSGLLGLRNYTNTELNQYISGYTQNELVEFFKTDSINDYYKNVIKNIYDLFYSIGIHPDYACRNLNRWSRCPNGYNLVEEDDKKVLKKQECIYLREEDAFIDDTYNVINNFIKNLQKDLDAPEEDAWNKLNAL